MISRNRRRISSVRSGPLFRVARHAQHLRFALRPVEIDGVAVGVLGDADLAREARAVVEQLVDARIHGVDFTAQFHDVERWRARRRGLHQGLCGHLV